MLTKHDGGAVEFANFDGITRIFGISRSRQYQLIADGRITAVKAGGRTLMRVESVRRFMNSLPPADVRPREAA